MFRAAIISVSRAFWDENGGRLADQLKSQGIEIAAYHEEFHSPNRQLRLEGEPLGDEFNVRDGELYPRGLIEWNDPAGPIRVVRRR